MRGIRFSVIALALLGALWALGSWSEVIIDSQAPVSVDRPLVRDAIPADDPQLLQGSFCHWSGSSSSFGSSSTVKWARFDGGGRFVYGRIFTYSGSSGSYENRDPEKGGTYEVKGEMVLLRYDEGGCDVAQVKSRLSEGVITEMLFEGELYSPSLCR